MLNECPKIHSCGFQTPFWSDQLPPKKVGVISTIDAYESLSFDNKSNCKWVTIQLETMRCALATDDIIYRYTGSVGYYDVCVAGFCSMM